MKKVLLFLLGVLSLVGLVSCSNSSTSNSTSTSTVKETTAEASIVLPYIPR